MGATFIKGLGIAGLGKDGGGRNSGYQRIAFDNGLGGHVQHGQPVAVHQNHLWLEPQAHHGAAHGQQRGLKDVQAVDLLDAGFSDAAAQRPCADLVKQGLAPRGGELFGVGQAGNGMEVIQDDRSRHHGPGQRATASLVHPGDQAGGVPGQAGLLRRRGFCGSHRQPVGTCRAAGFRAGR